MVSVCGGADSRPRGLALALSAQAKNNGGLAEGIVFLGSGDVEL